MIKCFFYHCENYFVRSIRQLHQSTDRIIRDICDGKQKTLCIMTSYALRITLIYGLSSHASDCLKSSLFTTSLMEKV